MRSGTKRRRQSQEEGNQESMRIIWAEKADLEPAGGHGADFSASDRPTAENMIAVVRGFGWHDATAETVEVFIRPPDEVYSAAFLATAKQVIEEYLTGKRDVVDGFWARGWLTPEIYLSLNC